MDATLATQPLLRDQDAIERSLRGDSLFGDDFGPADIARWYEQEQEAYAGLGAGERESYRYSYHAMNQLLGFRHLPDGPFQHALGLGSAYGLEFEPLTPRIRKLTIVEASQTLRSERLGELPVDYVDPDPSGRLPFEDETFDLMTVLGVLHHIPNVSFVIGELARCLAPGGHIVLREPIVSMGDWRRPRPHLTALERGIPLPLLRRMVTEAGLQVVREAPCLFPPVGRAWKLVFGRPVQSSALGVRLDAALARAFRFNYRYHAESRWQKLRPSSVCLVLTR